MAWTPAVFIRPDRGGVAFPPTLGSENRHRAPGEGGGRKRPPRSLVVPIRALLGTKAHDPQEAGAAFGSTGTARVDSRNPVIRSIMPWGSRGCASSLRHSGRRSGSDALGSDS